jgi:hypothetical protein
LLRSPQEIQTDFEDEAKASAGLWSQGKKKKKKKKKNYYMWCGRNVCMDAP